MPTDVTIPAVGESITEGVLGRWLVDDGAWVEADQPIFELETDKVSTEVPSPGSGVITRQAEEGATVEIGAVVAVIDGSQAPPDPATVPEPGQASTGPEPGPEPRHLSPAVASLVAEHGLDPRAIPATGKDGRLLKGDVLAYLERKLPPTPAASRPTTAAAARPALPTTTTPTIERPGEHRQRMSPLRKRIAQRLVASQRTAAILTTFNEVDMTAVKSLRARFKDEFGEKHQTGLGFMGFFVKAVVEALDDFPLINARIEGDDVVKNEHVHMGIAVGTERGLVVPVLRQAESMGFADIEAGIRAFAKKAREGSLAISDMEGGTFTITNGGVYGSMMSTPIINPPQSGILGMHAIQDRPVALDGHVVIRPMMYLALSYDHRIVDGAEAVGFLVRVKHLIEAPERLLLGL